MKTIQLTDGKWPTAQVIKAVAELPSSANEGIAIDQMRKRIRILDALDAAKDGAIKIEDADHGVLVSLIQKFPFAVADRELLEVIDAIEAGR